MNTRETLFQAAQEIAVPVHGQLGVQPADDVEFGGTFGMSQAGAMPYLFERHGVGGGILGALAEGAQLAGCHADVGRIDVAVDVEIRDVAVQALAHEVGHVADGEQVGGAVQRQAVVIVEPLAGLHFVEYRQQAAVLKLRLEINHRPLHCIRISAVQNAKNSTLM